MAYSIYSLYGLAQYAGGEVAKRLHVTALQLAGDGSTKFGISTEPGSFLDDFAFSLAVMAAFAAQKLEQADQQRFARSTTDLLSDQENEWGIVPNPMLNVWKRRRVLAARKKAARGAARGPLETVLQALLGDNYVGIHAMRLNEIGMFPANMGDQPQSLQLPGIERKLIKILPPVSINLGTPQWVAYQPVDPLPHGSLHTLRIGDAVVAQPETLGITETVVVTDLSTDATVGSPTFGSPTFQATFNGVHDPNVDGAVMPYGVWMSTQRSIIVVVRALAAIDPETRRQVHEQLVRTMPTVSTWSIVQQTGFMQAGPFILDLSPLSATPFGVVSVP